MQIVKANWDYYGDIMDMVLKFWAATPYGNVPMVESKAAELVISFLEANPKERMMLVVVDDDNKAVGFLAGVASETLLTRDKLAHEMAWWMEPRYRKSRWSLKLVEGFEFWAIKVAKCKLIQMSTVETPQVQQIANYYSRKGYRHVERSFLKEI